MKHLTAVVIALQATFSVSTDVVVVPVTVVDADGHVVSGLSQHDFRLFDEGRLQPLSLFTQADSPVSLGLVVDHSLSMRPKRAAVAAGLKTFLSSARPDDELFVSHFNDGQTAGIYDKPFANKPTELAATFPSEPPLGGTALYDAVIAGLRRLSRGQRDKRALVLISDGGDNASQATRDDMMALARASNAAIYAVGLTGSPRDKGVLRQISEESGGVAYFAKSPTDVGRVLAQIGTDLRQQYILGFTPNETGDRRRARRLRVTVSSTGRGRLSVRTRTFYVPRQGS
jgi:Ca-activated chloride channel family protein